MTVLFVSKALRELIPNSELIEPVSALAVEPSPHWQGHAFKLQRRHCVLLMHQQTRFPLLLVGLKKADFADLSFSFNDALMNTLLKMGASEKQLYTAQSILTPLQLKKASNRSVQATINLMKSSVEHLLWYQELNITQLSPIQTSLWLAERPCRVKGSKECIWPAKAMLAYLDSIVSTA